MKIIHLLPDLKGGGIQNLLVSLAPAQANRNNEVTLILTDKNDLDYSIKLEKSLKSKGIKVFHLNRKVHNKISAISAILKCIRYLRQTRPEILHSHGRLAHFFGAICALFIKGRHVLTIHNSPERWKYYLSFLNKNKPLIYCSQESFKANTHVSKTKIVIPNGVDKNIVVSKEVSSIRKELGLNKDSRLIVSVGSLREQKNYPFLIEIAKEYANDNIHFLICGGHYGKGYINPNIFSGYNNVHWLGLRSDVSSIENECNCFLSCSKFEGLPIAVLEAFYVGIPCVLSPIPSHCNIAQDVFGCYIPSKFDISSFKASIKDAINLTEEKSEVLKKRENSLSKFSVDRTADSYVKFYKGTICK